MDKKILEFANRNIELSDIDKLMMIHEASLAYEKFMDALRIDWRNDPNSSDTPSRVAKSFVNDLISGCYNNPPTITNFDNVDSYTGIVFSGRIDMKSLCAHHHLTFLGHAYVAYIPAENGKIIGLSKLNRIVEWFSRRPQNQENLTTQIHEYIDRYTPGNQGVAVLIAAKHLCACVRGVKHDSNMITSKLSGAFFDNQSTKDEFYKFIDYSK